MPAIPCVCRTNDLDQRGPGSDAEREGERERERESQRAKKEKGQIEKSPSSIGPFLSLSRSLVVGETNVPSLPVVP